MAQEQQQHSPVQQLIDVFGNKESNSNRRRRNNGLNKATAFWLWKEEDK